MLNLGEIERKLLSVNNAISTDGNGGEVLRGLSVAESNFVVAVEQTASENVGAAESEAYKELRRKHLSSRQMHNVRSADRKKDAAQHAAD
ncbi:hypothetical protein NHH88_24570 [Oxalobacteraceae bacterium OTU3CAMAD1]|nr:hypothetical protein NHH88_24570 [Oxalobacteraceae bacterium OTU3CAMAD1]